MMKIFGVCLAILLAAAAMASPPVETQYLQGLGDTRYEHIDSAIVERGYHLYVMLPEGYASGSMDDPMFREPALTWIDHWSDEDNKPWQLETVTLEGHSHMSAPPASFRHGMIWLFADDQAVSGP